jgi:hypothetical protein
MRFIGTIDGSKFHVIAGLRHTLWPVGDIGATIIGHDIGISASASGRIIDSSSFISKRSAVIVHMLHYLILLSIYNPNNITSKK